jgi:hypothetical protein
MMGHFLCFIYGFYFVWNDAAPLRSASLRFASLRFRFRFASLPLPLRFAIVSLNPEYANIPTPHSAVVDG